MHMSRQRRTHTQTHILPLNFVKFWQSCLHHGCDLMSNKESRKDLNPTGDPASADNITLDCWWRHTVCSTTSPYCTVCTGRHRKPINVHQAGWWFSVVIYQYSVEAQWDKFLLSKSTIEIMLCLNTDILSVQFGHVNWHPTLTWI